MPDERREFHKIRPASHTLLSVNCLYQMNAAKRKGVFTKLRRKRGPIQRLADAGALWAEQCDGRHSVAELSSAKIGKPRSGVRLQPTAKAVGIARGARKPRRGERLVSHTSGNIVLHLVFSTVERRPLITPAFRDDLFAYLGGIAWNACNRLIVNGAADHVHMLVRIRPSHSAADLARVIRRVRAGGCVRNGVPPLDGKPDTGCLASANQMSPPSQNISPTRKSTTGSIRFRKSLSHFSRKTMWPTTRNTSGVRFLSPLRGSNHMSPHPRLAPWAAFLRRSAANVARPSPPAKISRARAE